MELKLTISNTVLRDLLFFLDSNRNKYEMANRSINIFDIMNIHVIGSDVNNNHRFIVKLRINGSSEDNFRDRLNDLMNIVL